MTERKGLVIGIVIVCVVLAGVTFYVMSPKKSTQTSEYQELKTKSEEMAEKQRAASPNTPVPVDSEDNFVRPTGKGPQKVGG